METIINITKNKKAEPIAGVKIDLLVMGFAGGRGGEEMKIFSGFLLSTAILSLILWLATEIYNNNFPAYKMGWNYWLLIYPFAVVIVVILLNNLSPQ